MIKKMKQIVFLLFKSDFFFNDFLWNVEGWPPNTCNILFEIACFNIIFCVLLFQVAYNN